MVGVPVAVAAVLRTSFVLGAGRRRRAAAGHARARHRRQRPRQPRHRDGLRARLRRPQAAGRIAARTSGLVAAKLACRARDRRRPGRRAHRGRGAVSAGGPARKRRCRRVVVTTRRRERRPSPVSGLAIAGRSGRRRPSSSPTCCSCWPWGSAACSSRSATSRLRWRRRCACSRWARSARRSVPRWARAATSRGRSAIVGAVGRSIALCAAAPHVPLGLSHGPNQARPRAGRAPRTR